MTKRMAIDRPNLPTFFPTHRHQAAFWEALGRAVATFGFLEEVLGKAIFAYTSTRQFERSAAVAAYDNWLRELDRALIDPLGSQIDLYEASVRAHHQPTTDITALATELRTAASYRNVICHGSWREPDEKEASAVFFVNRKKETFEGNIDVDFLRRLQEHTTELICDVIERVTDLGWQFPGSDGPGEPIWQKS